MQTAIKQMQYAGYCLTDVLGKSFNLANSNTQIVYKEELDKPVAKIIQKPIPV